ncbi:unnamed protein product [Schistosoma margrebowiei]|uniref:Uncharacterized protein n=1 Tax=Schistosoma margrebowiei TaxID=48269 RepID=A0A183M3L2_9TREM|nr:unnamed protein product [Schistosoma margrebowiei]
MVVGGSRQETLDPCFVLLGTRQQGVPVIFRELVLWTECVWMYILIGEIYGFSTLHKNIMLRIKILTIEFSIHIELSEFLESFNQPNTNTTKCGLIFTLTPFTPSET